MKRGCAASGGWCYYLKEKLDLASGKTNTLLYRFLLRREKFSPSQTTRKNVRSNEEGAGLLMEKLTH